MGFFLSMERKNKHGPHTNQSKMLEFVLAYLLQCCPP